MSSVWASFFLLTFLQILIWGEKVLTLCQKMHFFWQNNTFSFRNCKKKRFRLRFLKTMHSSFSRHLVSQDNTEAISFIFNPKQRIFWAFECFWPSFPVWDETLEFATVFLGCNVLAILWNGFGEPHIQSNFSAGQVSQNVYQKKKKEACTIIINNEHFNYISV